MKPFFLRFFQQNQLFCVVGRNFMSGRRVELVWKGSYKNHVNGYSVLLVLIGWKSRENAQDRNEARKNKIGARQERTG